MAGPVDGEGMMDLPTYWNGEKCRADRVKVVVGPAEKETFWYHGMQGTVRQAVRVNYHGRIFYLDNEDGDGWAKVTRGHGSPQWGHKSISVDADLGTELEQVAMFEELPRPMRENFPSRQAFRHAQRKPNSTKGPSHE